MSAALEIDDLTVRYGSGRRAVTAVDRVTLTVPKGGALGLVGESGSGKSTLARAVVGLTRVHGGRIMINGRDVTHQRLGTRAAQLVFQEPYASLNPRMPVGEAIGEAVRGDARCRAAEVRRLLALVALDPDLAGRLPGQMSGGQRQRIALARALAARPDVLVADEITSSLDVSVQGAILNLVRDLRVELGLSLLFISHNLAVVRYISDQMAVMRGGRVVEQGPVERLVAAAEHPYTAELIAAVPRLGRG